MSTYLRSVDSPARGVVATVTAPLAHRCPFVAEDDTGTITLAWQVGTHTLELHALAAYLTAFADVVISHEALTLSIAAQIGAVEGLAVVSVVTRWRTAGMDVVCEVGGALLREPVNGRSA